MAGIKTSSWSQTWTTIGDAKPAPPIRDINKNSSLVSLIGRKDEILEGAWIDLIAIW